MTGLFTYRNFSLQDTPPLDGKIAVVTGGQAGIGLEITAQLLLHNIQKVYIVARNRRKYEAAREYWRHQTGIFFGDNDDRVEFIQCDLADIPSAKRAAEEIRHKIDRIHMVICNAGMGVSPKYFRSAQNIETVFAANCVGHQILVTILLPLLKKVSAEGLSSEARVVVTTSSMHSFCRQLDMDLLTAPTHTKPKTIDGIWRYGRSKLGNILFTKELTRRLGEDGEPGSSRIYVNCFFPGNIVTEQWGAWNDLFGKAVGVVMRAVFAVILGQSLEDGAATALYLAASHEVRRQDQRGQYFIPIAKPYSPTKISCDQKLARDVWDWIDAKATETLGSDWQDKTGDGLAESAISDGRYKNLPFPSAPKPLA